MKRSDPAENRSGRCTEKYTETQKKETPGGISFLTAFSFGSLDPEPAAGKRGTFAGQARCCMPAQSVCLLPADVRDVCF